MCKHTQTQQNGPHVISKCKVSMELFHFDLLNLFVTSVVCSQCMESLEKLVNLSSSLGTTLWAFLDSFTVTYGGRTNGVAGGAGGGGGIFFTSPRAILWHCHWLDDRNISCNTPPFVPVGHPWCHFHA